MGANILKQFQMKDDHEIEMIPIEKIVFNKYNYFSMDEGRVEALCDEILTHGFKSAIEVREISNDMYELIAGETRTRALLKAYDRTKDQKYLMVPAYVSNMSDDEAHERLIIDELLKRNHTSYEKMRAVEELQDLYRKRKKEERILGRIQWMIAESLSMKKSQVGTYQKVSSKASDAVKEKLRREEISVESAALLADLPQDKQDEFIADSKNYRKQDIEDFKNLQAAVMNVSEKQLKFDEAGTFVEEEISAEPLPKRHIGDIVKDLYKTLEELEVKISMIEFKDELILLREIKKECDALSDMLGVQ